MASITTIVMICATVLLAITVSEARPGTPRFSWVDIDCAKDYSCDDDETVCATDGNTYPNKCAISVKNQNNFCSVGDFNPVAFVHDGVCNTSGYK